MTEIQKHLFEMQDPSYRDFQAKLIPTIAPGTMIGVRTPALRAFAKELAHGDVTAFLHTLPHSYFEENQLHAFLISGMQDFDRTIEALDAFLPFVDNWATCDQTCPKSFRRQHARLRPVIRRWMAQEHPYTVRFGIKLLMDCFLDADFKPEILACVAEVQHPDYYVNMMRAWFFATALAKQWDATLPLLESRRLDVWTHNKTIQKAVESLRISPDRKAYLRSLRM